MFSGKASRDEKLAFMFSVYDVDGDGILSRDDLLIMLRQLAGSSMSDAELDEVIDRVLKETQASAPATNASVHGIDLQTYKTTLAGVDLSHMVVEVPIEY
eukprot:CAMPEP_0175059698 /NCGR_PEP_ID=MMETSP0052_2-20121109/12578_1 /TAXON_ID=51329 ORGANISM="Polytomella parva, Strain SAG 63-3" /NCGR_SAMPLE_ID=MMETSP0052_2 /ASSEMBLY_ACC=CAM_ASM_000194 /LENGTH=99 /DNA_ID=CAMNT_0016325279 /DNA_START=284 /DNA_END=583 /DNA_ORIENTATION=-